MERFKEIFFQFLLRCHFTAVLIKMQGNKAENLKEIKISFGRYLDGLQGNLAAKNFSH